jgi:hypothetical protein
MSHTCHDRQASLYFTNLPYYAHGVFGYHRKAVTRLRVSSAVSKAFNYRFGTSDKYHITTCAQPLTVVENKL